MVDYDATGTQKYKIAKLSSALGISEPIECRPMTKGEAGRLIRELYSQLKLKRSNTYKPKLERRYNVRSRKNLGEY